MDFVIEFNADAFKHGVDEADIRKARHSFGMTMTQAIYDGFLDEPSDDDARDKYLLIGFDCMRRVRSTLRQIPYLNNNL